jgi:hypothetical protein
MTDLNLSDIVTMNENPEEIFELLDELGKLKMNSIYCQVKDLLELCIKQDINIQE